MKKVSNETGIPRAKLKGKIRDRNKEKKSRVNFKKRKINGVWHIAKSEMLKFSLEAECLKGDYYSITEAARIIGRIYHDSNETKCSSQLSEWIHKGLMEDITVRPETCLNAYIKKQWVDEFAKTKKYRVNETCRMLSISKRTFYRRIKLPDKEEYRIRLEQFPTGRNYITENEIKRLKSIIINVGDRLAVGGVGSGIVAKIVPCEAYKMDAVNFCYLCEEKKRYVLKDVRGSEILSMSSFPGFCRKAVEKIN